MSGRPPTPPKDEEMEDANRPIGAGAGPAPAAPEDNSNRKAFIVKFLEYLRDLSKETSEYRRTERSNRPNQRKTLESKIKEIVENEDLKKYSPTTYRSFQNNLVQLDKLQEVKPEDLVIDLEYAIYSANAILTREGESLGIPKQEMEGGKRRKTRKSKKSLRKKTNVRKTSSRRH